VWIAAAPRGVEDLAGVAVQRLRVLTGDDHAALSARTAGGDPGCCCGQARVLCVQRTGWGSPLCTSWRPRCCGTRALRPTLIVSPLLLALVRNQIVAAQRLGLRAHKINSTNREDAKAGAGKPPRENRNGKPGPRYHGCIRLGSERRTQPYSNKERKVMKKGPPINDSCYSMEGSKVGAIRRQVEGSYIGVAKSLIDLAGECVKVEGVLKLVGVHPDLKGELLLHGVFLAPKLRRLVTGRVRSTEAKVRHKVSEGGSDIAANAGESIGGGEDFSFPGDRVVDGSLQFLRIVAVIIECESQDGGALLIELPAVGGGV
jgi:hypothetical protein